MMLVDWLVVAGASATIYWINWYFFLADRDRAAATGGDAG